MIKQLKTSKIMTQNNMTTFNLGKALKGAKVVTRLGYPVTIITKTNDGKLLAQVEHGAFYSRKPEKWQLDGSKYSATAEHFLDLFMAA